MFGIEFLMGISSGLVVVLTFFTILALIFFIVALGFYFDHNTNGKAAVISGSLLLIFSLSAAFFNAINPETLFEKRLALLKYEAISKENIKFILDKGVPQIERIADALIKKLENSNKE